MKRYFYDGLVKEFDTVVDYRFKAETVAVSERQARNNLAYQWKMSHRRAPDSRITLPGKLRTMDE